jgi:hypothetical protein
MAEKTPPPAKKLEFQVPEEMQLPEDTKEGDEFDALATVKMGAEGKLTLVALDGYTLPESEEDGEGDAAGKEENDAPKKEDNPKFEDAVAMGMGYK